MLNEGHGTQGLWLGWGRLERLGTRAKRTPIDYVRKHEQPKTDGESQGETEPTTNKYLLLWFPHSNGL